MSLRIHEEHRTIQYFGKKTGTLSTTVNAILILSLFIPSTFPLQYVYCIMSLVVTEIFLLSGSNIFHYFSLFFLIS